MSRTVGYHDVELNRKPARPRPDRHRLTTASPQTRPRAPWILGRLEDPDYFDDIDYDEEEDKDNTPGVHAHPILLTY
ncbi:unnamed protein product [Urochloa humidicola]